LIYTCSCYVFIYLLVDREIDRSRDSKGIDRKYLSTSRRKNTEHKREVNDKDPSSSARATNVRARKGAALMNF
jgi:hypothetical protein